MTEGVIADTVALCKSQAIIEFDEFMTLKYGGGPFTPAQRSAKANDEASFQLRMTTGFYQWGGLGMDTWRNTRNGSLALVKILCDAGGNHLTDADIFQLVSDGGEKLGRVVAAVTWDAEFPNVPRPAELTNPTGQ